MSDYLTLEDRRKNIKAIDAAALFKKHLKHMWTIPGPDDPSNDIVWVSYYVYEKNWIIVHTLEFLGKADLDVYVRIVDAEEGQEDLPDWCSLRPKRLREIIDKAPY